MKYSGACAATILSTTAAENPFGPFLVDHRIQRHHGGDSNHAARHRDIVIGDQPDAFAPPMFIAMDPPKHDVQRKAATPAVAPARLADLEVLIRQRAGAILDALPRNETFNWVDHVSKELTTQMLATLFDFPWEDRHLLPYWSDVTTTADTVGVEGVDMAARERILMECLAYFTDLWRRRAAEPPKFDFISLMAHNPETKAMVDNPMELMGNLMLLIVGGNDTTRNSISGGLLALNQYPEQYARLKADRSLIPSMCGDERRCHTANGVHIRGPRGAHLGSGRRSVVRSERCLQNPQHREPTAGDR